MSYLHISQVLLAQLTNIFEFIYIIEETAYILVRLCELYKFGLSSAGVYSCLLNNPQFWDLEMWRYCLEVNLQHVIESEEHG